MKLAVQFYDKSKISLMGSFGVLQLDGRKNIDNEISELRESNISWINRYNSSIEKTGNTTYVKPDRYYMRVFKGGIYENQRKYLTDYIDITNNISILETDTEKEFKQLFER